jgi:hypothetical protein
MTEAERESFLAGVHIGVLAVSGERTLAVPVWYQFEGGEVRVWMERDSRKDKAIRAAGRFSLVAQTEELPYKYVSVEGPVVANDVPPTRDEAIAIAGRYLTAEQAASYVDGALGEQSILVRMRPERWLSNDQGK